MVQAAELQQQQATLIAQQNVQVSNSMTYFQNDMLGHGAPTITVPNSSSNNDVPMYLPGVEKQVPAAAADGDGDDGDYHNYS